MADQDNNDQDKTEEPTARKLQKAREEGNVSKSRELTSVLLLIMATLTLYGMGGWMYARIRSLFVHFYRVLDQPVVNTPNAINYLVLALQEGLIVLIPLLLVLVVGSILVNLLQTGPVFTTKSMEVKPDRLDPSKGIKKLVSTKGLVELVKGFTKIFIVGIIIYFSIKGSMSDFVGLPSLPLYTILSMTGKWTFLIVIRVLIALLLLSIVDAVYQRYQYRKELRMTKQEVRDEMKQMEGDPAVKGSRRKKAMKLAFQRRLDHAVLGSDVVITNPTHYAVALHYDPEKSDAPVIMAKGMRRRAFKIKEFARKYEITIVENPPVARALYAAADEGQAVPPELYQAVAEILAYVYRLKEKSATGTYAFQS